MTTETRSRLTSRKFIVALLSLAALSLLCWFGKIDGAQFITGLAWTVGAYMTANWAQAKAPAQ